MSVANTIKYLFAAFLAATVAADLSGCTNSVFVESQDVTQGAIGNFEIGMTKQQVLEVARQKGVSAIRPILRGAPSVNFSNLNSLVLPASGRAIELSAEGGGKVIFTLSDCHVIGVRPIGDLHDSWSGFVGQSLEDLNSGLKNALQKDHSLSVREVISSDNQAWFKLADPEPKGSASIIAYDVWSFEVSATKPAGSEFIIYFSEGSVVRISYKRPRVRLD